MSTSPDFMGRRPLADPSPMKGREREASAIFEVLSESTASVTILFLLVEDGDWPFGLSECICLLVAILVAACATIPLRTPQETLSKVLARATSRGRFDIAPFHLSPREKQYVLETAAGKESKEIAADLRLSASTVRNGIHSAMEKMGLTKSAELVALGMVFDIVDSESPEKPWERPPRAGLRLKRASDSRP
jgi:DNA-binding HTH domain-containing proteins